uniref:Protein phosphatase 2C 70 n=1 Tax=Tanacetum cinerariifolium TaxID=118510 RepID=A0A6L2JZC5_TANCI|nr:protein phosphatase 2C 70 [Tanacetum cinerariifolium]
MDEVVVCGDVAVKGRVNVVKDGLFSCNSECGCGNYICKETCHPGVYGDCELLPVIRCNIVCDMSSYISVRSVGSILNFEKLKWELVDLDSLNGTLLNYKAVHHPQIRSRHRGDAVELTSENTITLGTTSKLSESLFAKKLPAPLQPNEANGKRTSPRQRKLICDDECSKLECKKVLADAFGVNTSVSLAYHICHGQGHIAKEYKEKKQEKDSQWFKDKALLMEAKEKGVALDAKAEAFLADVECTAHYDDSLAITTTTAFEVIHEDAYDSDLDEAPHAIYWRGHQQRH